VDKEKKQLLILVALVPFFLLIVFWSIKTTSKKTKKKPKTAATPGQISSFPTPFGQDVPMSVQAVQKKKKRSEPEYGRDPFVEKEIIVEQEKGPESLLDLQGISWDAENPYAIIDGNVVEVGDQIGGYRIVDIKQFSVTIKNEEEEIELRI